MTTRTDALNLAMNYLIDAVEQTDGVIKGRGDPNEYMVPQVSAWSLAVLALRLGSPTPIVVEMAQ